MAISMKEMLKDKKLEDLPEEHQANLLITFEKINKVRAKYGKPMTPTSVYRSLAEHLAIYKRKGITDQKLIPMKSKHLFGQAIDIADPEGKLKEWCKANETFLLEVGLWLEHYDSTVGWCHFQTVPYGSWKVGKSIWFKP
jgi:uncharacterized protein YcbK (DUF882 family)